MRIKVTMISRETYEFEVPVEDPQEFLDSIKPKELFHRPLHQFCGKMRSVSINPEWVEWIEVETVEVPKIRQLRRDITFYNLTPEVFQSRVSLQKNQIMTLIESGAKQDALLAFGKATFKSGRILHVEIAAQKMDVGSERTSEAQKIFSMPALILQGEFSGLHIVNPKNIAVWQVVPGLKKPAPYSLQAELMAIAKSKE